MQPQTCIGSWLHNKLQQGMAGPGRAGAGDHWRRMLKPLAHFLDHTARSPKETLEAMADRKPIQLKDISAAEAAATPNMMGIKHNAAGSGVL